MTRVRLVKVICHAVFVEDNGDTLRERVPEPVAVSAADWPDVVAMFEDARQELERALCEKPETPPT